MEKVVNEQHFATGGDSLRIKNKFNKVKKDSPLFAILFVILVLLFFSLEFAESSSYKEQENTIASYPVMAPKTVEVKLERVYLDGEISEEVIKETILSMEDFWAFYDDWQLIDQNEEVIHFRQYIDDISPLLKINGYFGISNDGFFNLYEGKPIEENIIQSFFQINTKKLKSHQHIELKEGIPVMTTDNYKEVIQMFRQYAVSEL